MASSSTMIIRMPMSFPSSNNLTSPRRLKLAISSASSSLKSSSCNMSKRSDDDDDQETSNKLQYHHHRLPPGPVKLPLIGNLHNLFMMGSRSSLPHHALRYMADEYGDLLHLQLGEVSAVVVSSAKMAREVMKTHDHIFADRPRILAVDIGIWGSQDIAFCPLGDYWRQMKRISITDLLGAKKVQSFAPIREAEVSNLISTIRRSAKQGLNPINISEKIYSLFNVIICKSAFGSHEWIEEDIINSMQEAAMVAGGFHMLDFYPSLEFLHAISGLKSRILKLRDHKDGILDRVIEEHKQKMMERRQNGESLDDEDFVDVFVRLQGDESLQCPITNTSIKAVLVDMFVVGTDTSSVAVEWAMSEIMKNPRVLNKAQNEIRHVLKGKRVITEEDIQGLTYLKLVIKETFRLHPSIPLLIPRESNRDCVVGGYIIPSGTRVIVNAWAIGRDPETWEDPERFNPERFDDGEVDFRGNHFELIPFGAGRRICPGISYAMANIELLLAHLLYHFDWELPEGATTEDLCMSEVFGLAVGRKNQLHLVAKPVDLVDEPDYMNV